MANKLGADIGTVIVYGLLVGLMASLIGGPLYLKFLGNRLPFKPVPAEFSDLKVRDEVRYRRWVLRCLPFCCRLADAGKNRR